MSLKLAAFTYHAFNFVANLLIRFIEIKLVASYGFLRRKQMV